MPDSLNDPISQREKEKAIRFALKFPAGHISSKTPVAMAIHAALKERPEKKGSLNLDNLSPIELKRTLSSLNKDWINWLPDTIWHEFPCNDVTKDKILAIQTLLITPDSQFDIMAFSNIIAVFNDQSSDWNTLTPLPCEYLVYGWEQIKKINPNFERWHDLDSLIKACMVEDGVVYLPWIDIESLNGTSFDIPKLKLIWNKAKGNDLKATESDLGKPLNAQILKLKDIELYLNSMSGSI
jgi:hypothetical protein